MDRALFQQSLGNLGVNLDDDALDAFQAFEDRLYQANEVMNLTRVPREECWTRHFLDSLMFIDLIPEWATVLDIGTGPGFPAWPIARARPDVKVTALDSSGKMLGFLLANPLPNLTVVNSRAEEWPIRERFDIVTGRALAPLPTQLELSAAPCRVGGNVIAMRTPAEEFEQNGARKIGLELVQVIERPLPGTDVVRAFPIYIKTRPTPKAYPRRWPEMKSRPL